VLFVMELSTWKVEVAGIVPAPDGLWMTQIVRGAQKWSQIRRDRREPGSHVERRQNAFSLDGRIAVDSRLERSVKRRRLLESIAEE
jgi:hypothetical protein